MNEFLPVTKEEMLERGWEQPDFVYVCGDAYVDHPSFGAAIICRTLESHGYKVCFLAQPNWRDVKDFQRFGKPRLGFMISSGNIDSMVNHYTVSKRKRKKDSYTPNGESGKRPDRAVIVYSQMARQAYPDANIILGGIEASLRRLAHYDYWDNKVRKSIVIDANADLLMYGMGENSVIEVADALNSGIDIKDLTYLDGTVFKTKDPSLAFEPVFLPTYEEIVRSKEMYAKSFHTQYLNTDHVKAKTLVEAYQGWYVVQNRPNRPLTQNEFDRAYALPYTRNYHPMYKAIGHVPAIDEVKFSLISNRGCYGACNFCALTFHQGRVIQARSHESIVAEAKKMVWDPEFKGYIHDVGGPTANFREPSCEQQIEHGVCKEKQCLWPKPCNNLKVSHKDYLQLLQKLRELPNVKKVFVRSGIRYDYLMYDRDDRFFRELAQHHISGQLKVAPEHISNKVLDKMGKPHKELYQEFVSKYYRLNDEYHKNQYLVPYLMSSHPGSDLHAAIELAEYLRDIYHQPEQVQDFYPTPGTLSTAMYYTGIDPRDKKSVYVPKTSKEKAMQRALIQYRNPKNYDLVYEALTLAKRDDLIGQGKKCLIKDRSHHYERGNKRFGNDYRRQKRK
ncbi:putative radical SAM protein YgiQ [Breznakia sp. PF5-3]|uniref:YgiQ family radical SAM protein n=1 Tax=unclassified Breznakia TaxID=2623764 RepID=UPI0024072E55|nr:MULTISPECIES: YgiQ family radical SAM protein [unclassified Breznakia]MDF9824179.1 putative radical SAM protein YgiQ [Breznakia sp. PM6-1]MDF9834977.1 putative radical SAM protein YgiQ [Breznakia sp. PF5-3]MDF9837154.1 putative radical SAM protein YgiQ [Breznakia sp. PFB2-8]MDF9859144.1 putative radical SAM protein YgiQ [Breznakia sp. PH5-24]